ncbi:hypothetical protein Tco_0846764 [Tanacetum coccineum]
MGDENPIRTLGDYSKPSHEGYMNTIELPEGNNVGKNALAFISILPTRSSHLYMGGSYYPIPCSILSTGKDRKTPKRYPDVPTTSWRIYIRSMDSFQGLTPKSPSSWHRPLTLKSWELLKDLANDPRDFANPVKAIALPQDVPSTSDRRLIELENQVKRLMEAHLAPTQPTQVNKITTLCEICSGPHDTQYCMENPEQAFAEYASSSTDEAGALIATKQVRKLNSMLESLGLVPRSSNTKFVCSKEDDGEVMFIEIIRDDDEPQNEGPNEGEGATTEEPVVEYFDTFPTRDELTYHRIKGMHVFIGNLAYVVDFMIVEDISSIIDPRLSQVVLGRPFVEISNMTHDPPEGVVRFIKGADEVAYKMPHKIKQYDSLLDLEKEHTKSVYLRNKKDKRRGVEYVMSKILGFYKECLELGLEYLTGMDDEGEVTLYLMRRSLEVLRKFHWMILGGRFNQLSHLSSPLLSKPGEY